MNKTIKIFLLFVGVVVAVGMVFAYVKTKMSPPQYMFFSNQYIKNLKADIDLITEDQNSQRLDSLYLVITDQMDYLRREDYITQLERDKVMDEFVTPFLNVFKNNCDDQFERSGWWDENNLRRMKARVADLKTLTINNGTKKALEGEPVDNLDKISSTVDAYFDAKRQAGSDGRFHGVRDARTKIEKAKQFIDMHPLNNCTVLIDKLKQLPHNIESDHYKKLAAKVRGLNHFRTNKKLTYYSYKQKVERIRAEIKEYRDNTSFYERHQRTDGWLKQCDERLEQADRHFNNYDDVCYY